MRADVFWITTSDVNITVAYFLDGMSNIMKENMFKRQQWHKGICGSLRGCAENFLFFLCICKHVKKINWKLNARFYGKRHQKPL